jgi:hypothetical protein
MTNTELLLTLAWLIWVAFYIRLVWKHSGKDAPNYALFLLPILLPFERFWRPGSEIARIRVLATALALLFIQLTLANLGVPSGA